MTHRLIDYEDLFRRAVEDLNAYRGALDRWIDSNKEDFGLFLEVVTRWQRIFEAIWAMRERPDEYREYAEQYEKVFYSTAEPFNSAVVRFDATGMLRSGLERVSSVGEILEEVLGIYDEAAYLEDDEFHVMIEERGSDFLEAFRRLSYLFNISADLNVSGDTRSEYRQKFLSLMEKFRQLHYVFYPLREIITQMRNEAYVPDRHWWIRLDPPESGLDWDMRNIRQGQGKTEADEDYTLPDDVAKRVADWIMLGGGDPKVPDRPKSIFDSLTEDIESIAKTPLAENPGITDPQGMQDITGLVQQLDTGITLAAQLDGVGERRPGNSKPINFDYPWLEERGYKTGVRVQGTLDGNKLTISTDFFPFRKPNGIVRIKLLIGEQDSREQTIFGTKTTAEFEVEPYIRNAQYRLLVEAA
jgi:hypothetical protein